MFINIIPYSVFKTHYLIAVVGPGAYQTVSTSVAHTLLQELLEAIRRPQILVVCECRALQ